MMRKSTIGIVGGGLMGHGIAYLFAAAGHQIIVYEPNLETRTSLLQRWRQILELFDEDKAFLDRISEHNKLSSAVAGVTFVFEAAPERLALKQSIFVELVSIVAEDTVLASNSSAIPSTRIARGLTHRGRVVGAHFWNRLISYHWSK